MKVLAISYGYPPMSCPQAIQVSRILSALPAEVHVIFSGDKEFPVDTTIGQAENSVQLLEVPYLLPFWKKALREGASRLGLKVVLQSPDYFIMWFWAAYKAARKAITELSPDVIVTFGMPMSDHLLGLALKKKFNLPWVAHFSDPWIDNPFTQFSKATRAINRFQEKKVIAAADRVIFTSPQAMDLVMGKYPAQWKEKSSYVGHAFNPKCYPEAGGDNRDVVVRYLGGFYPPRTPQPLINALRLILDSTPEVLQGCRFELIGPIANVIKGDYADVGLPDELLTFREPVSYAESLELMRGADALLVIDAAEVPGIFFPSKLADYIGANRPILGMSDASGTSAGIIRSVGGRCANASSTNECAQLLREFLADPKGITIDQQAASLYEVNHVASQFLSVLETVVGQQS
ncbi:MAG: glycosyltransferase [Pseudodesulfovibrio sp.]|nr:glycosyltransferase [Pseudodesulfovibrio sp.]